MTFLAIDERGVVDDEVLEVERRGEVKESGAGIKAFEGGKCEHGSVFLVGAKHEYSIMNG